jgi:hypothetical protein
MNTATLNPTFNQLKKVYLDSGYEIRLLAARDLERLALDAPLEVKRHLDTDIMGLIMPDEGSIGIARELSVDERATTLLHELIHLYADELEEEDVEDMTLEIENNLSREQFGFLQFLVS